jgi:hypothetical protein
MIHWKWTQGEPYERSRRRQINSTSQTNQTDSTNHSKNSFSLDDTLLYDNKVLNDQQIVKQANNAFNIALNHDEYTWDMLNPSSQIITDQGFRQVNKREDTDKKLAERQMFANVSMNPFLTDNNYANDIAVQNDFLQPQTSDYSSRKE